MGIYQLILVLVLSAPVITAQVKTMCGDSTIEEKKGQLALDMKDKTLTITFKDTQTCDFTVTGFGEKDFTTTVSNFLLDAKDDCTKDYVKASPTDPTFAKDSLSVCVAKPVESSINSKDHKLYVSIKATKPAGKDSTRSVTLNFKTIQSPACEPTTISINEAILQRSYPPAEKKLVPVDCEIEVTGYQGRNFEMTIPAISFDNDCQKTYVAAADTTEKLKDPLYKQCGSSPITDAIKSNSSKMFLKIFTTQSAVTEPKVTFLFKTIFPECGSPEIQLNNGTQQLRLPATGDFLADSECTIKVSGMDKKNFGMTIKQINFPTNCEDGNVTAAGTKEALPNKNYTKCGMNPVEDRFESTDGVMFLQIKLGTIGNIKPTVTFEFTSGASTPGHYIFAMFSIFKLLSVTI